MRWLEVNKLKELRKNKKVTQQVVADYLGVGRDTVSKWEKGVNSIPEKKLICLADFYSVSIDYLLGRDTSPA
jgi:transcriptional regulator with XRE-family HTH domain